MSKLAHSNDETMAIIEANALANEGVNDNPPEPVHSPLPWFAHGPAGRKRLSGIVADNNYKSSSGAKRRIAWMGSGNPAYSKSIDEEDEANAAYIVKACNAYPDLVKALKEAISVLTDPVVGTYNADEPRWYGELDKAVKTGNALLNQLGEAS